MPRLRWITATSATLALWVVALFPVPAGATATTLDVSPAGTDGPSCGPTPNPCRSIGQAITNAVAGDTIAVAAGTYAEQVTVTKQLTLTGTDAVIDATGQSNGVLLHGASAAGTSISGFTIEHADLEGLKAVQTSNLTISTNTIVDNDRGFGTTNPGCQDLFDDCGEGLHLQTVTGSTVSGNTVNNGVGGILLTDEMGPTSGNTIQNNVVNDNIKDCGITLAGHNPAALAADGTRQPTMGGVFDNVVTGNTTNGNGAGGILIGVGPPGAGVYDNTISSNHADGNGLPGITIHAHAPNQDANGNVIMDNTVGVNGLGEGPGASPGDTDFGDTRTTGVLVASAVNPLQGIVVKNNTITGNTYGIWLEHVLPSAVVTGNTISVTRGDGRSWSPATRPRRPPPTVAATGCWAPTAPSTPTATPPRSARPRPRARRSWRWWPRVTGAATG